MDSRMARCVLPVTRRAEEHVVLGLQEVEGAEMGDDLPAQAALVVEIELLDGRARAPSSDRGVEYLSIRPFGAAATMSSP